MLPFLIKAKEIAFDILFPPICLNCQKHLSVSSEENKLLCEQCLYSIKINNTLFCPVCRARLAENKKICHKNAFYLLGAAGDYDDPILQNLIHYFKYKSFGNLTPLLGELLIKYLNNLFGNRSAGWRMEIRNFIIVPIPLHSHRERERGFNQAKLISEFIADHFNIRFIDALKRTKNNEPQAKIKGLEKRTKNISGCFKIENPGLIKGKNIILIDDVFTSGATMNEAVRVLKSANAKKIIALVLARA